MSILTPKELDFIHEHMKDNFELLTTLGKIPAPSHQEDKRAEFCLKYIKSLGVETVTIDAAKNVVCEIGCEGKEQVVILSAHTDVVFPDLDELPLTVEGDRISAPGIGDDTGNLVNLIMGLKYLLAFPGTCPYGIVLVANSCEEGLGNLDGTRQIMKTYEGRIKEFISFDGYAPQCCSRAVGSHRYRIMIKTEGGHSYANFGNTSAIKVAADLIEKLYSQNVPTTSKTSYNVGCIEAGTTVNTIAEKAVLLYEFRSETQDCLDIMSKQLDEIVAEMKAEGRDITVETLGIRPGNRAIPPEGLDILTNRNAEILSQYLDGPLDRSPYSTDSNLPLSLGIPANTIGTVQGAGAHTYGEWLHFPFQETGMKIVISILKKYRTI